MTDEAILKAAIKKAIENGYDCGDPGHYGQESCIKFLTEDYERPNTYTIIFDHSFAKAFWGDQPQVKGLKYKFEEPLAGFYATQLAWWQFCLQQMVLEEHPLKYLEQFLEKEDKQ